MRPQWLRMMLVLLMAAGTQQLASSCVTSQMWSRPPRRSLHRRGGRAGGGQGRGGSMRQRAASATAGSPVGKHGLHPVVRLQQHVGGSLHPIVAHAIEEVPQAVGAVPAGRWVCEPEMACGLCSCRLCSHGVHDACARPQPPDGINEARCEDGNIEEVCGGRRRRVKESVQPRLCCPGCFQGALPAARLHATTPAPSVSHSPAPPASSGSRVRCSLCSSISRKPASSAYVHSAPARGQQAQAGTWHRTNASRLSVRPHPKRWWAHTPEVVGAALRPQADAAGLRA